MGVGSFVIKGLIAFAVFIGIIILIGLFIRHKIRGNKSSSLLDVIAPPTTDPPYLQTQTYQPPVPNQHQLSITPPAPTYYYATMAHVAHDYEQQRRMAQQSLSQDEYNKGVVTVEVSNAV